MKIIDTHTHLYLSEFEEDLSKVVEEAIRVGVSKFLLPAIDSTTHKHLLSLTNSYPEHFYPMMGLHPTSVKENYMDELAIVHHYLTNHSFVAIGEVGIDLYWDMTFEKQQVKAFKIQAQWAREMGLPIVVHSRNSTEVILQVLEEIGYKGLSGVFHCFNGTLEQALEIASKGFYLGIGGVITYKNSSLSSIVARVPRDFVVVETDAPYLPPVPHRGKRNQPAWIKYTVNKLAEIWQISPEEAAGITTANAIRLFQKNCDLSKLKL
ncbi:MAG TPA: TatD family hydrolase [Bacteroidales bacterium]|jgi:TatD DNase family protein|nr:MAG: putative deoxyribonuclease YcfH [Bacteroidetes bacterium ADurb.Bin012]HNQ59939.1 TatD family hydrolase [Bacteroidales bacterium]HNU21621.1 TatD family hydrolase [Bacteroidales bacterium]HNV16997.1 TatD family hydrolase [Bacteroidales bacterium]HNZ79037.1 TatD family hydrolase [Bacteroidales bacterium]